MTPVPGSKSVEATGAILSAQVKTVEGAENPRVKLSRVDATDLLRQKQATCLFGLRLSDGSIHFQFLTREFIDCLTDFLASSHDEFSISHENMSDDGPVFQKLLRRYTDPFEQLRLRIHLVRRRVTSAISGADLTVQSTGEDTVCQVYVPWAASAFTVEPSARENVRLRVLRGGDISAEQTGVQLHPAIIDVLEETRTSLLSVVGVTGERANVGIEYQTRTATERFSRHSYESEISYVHRAGLRLTYDTDTTVLGGAHVHAMESEIFEPVRRVPLTGKVLVFFRLFKPGAVLSLRPGWSLPLSSFGDSLEHVGEVVEPIPHLCQSLSLSPSQIGLPDLKDEEFVRSSWFLEALLLKGIAIGQMLSGFIVGPAADLPLEQVPTSPISISVPTVLNWKDKGIAVWVDCDGDAFLHEGLVCGIRFTRQRSWRVEKGERFRKSTFPELWVAKEWPAIRIGADMSGAQSWTFDPTDVRPLEAVITAATP
jgi:hypothetical protein